MLRDSERADFQANGVLALSKRLGRPPHDLAEEVVAAAQLADICEEVVVSGPGFINLTLSNEFIAGQVSSVALDARLGVPQVSAAKTVVVDYSAPNVAKELHVGHLRTTLIGDALCRMLGFVGHDVRRQNHVGDWGTPFGMLIEHLVDLGIQLGAEGLAVGDLDEFYRQARRSFDADEAFRERSRARVVMLQSGDPDTLALWRALVSESVRHFDEVYRTLGVLLTDDDIDAESSYNPMLPSVVADLRALGLLVEDDGAQCVFPPGFTNRNGEPLPLIVQKSDGGFGYAATDLAALRHRVSELGANRILYVVGAPQAQHLAMVAAVARMAGWLPDDVAAVHVSFANVLGPDHKMLRTRTGESVKMIDLLHEAIQRASAALEARRPGRRRRAQRWERRWRGPDTRRSSPRDRGDQVPRTCRPTARRDYVFDWERMLAFEGNTGPYLQYAHARIRSIFRRAELAPPMPVPQPTLSSPHERALALSLLGFGEAVQGALEVYGPNKLCGYLFELASRFTSFYENCPVLRAPDEETRRSRLILSDLTARVLAQGLSLLGIESPERM